MTASIIVSMLCAYLMCFSVMFFLISRRLTGQRMGMNVFAVGHLMLSSAYILQMLGISTVLSHTLTLVAPLAYCIASMRFFGQKAPFWKTVIFFSAAYTAAQFFALFFGGELAQYALLSLCACLLFLGMSVVGAYGIRSFAKDVSLEMLLFVLLLGSFAILNGIKFFKLLHSGMDALDMSTPFQTVFYIYMLSMTTVLPPTMIWLVLRRLTDELRTMATRDPLTRLLNRRGLLEAIDQSLRSKKASSAQLLILDVDHFKSINDTYGHQVGDLVLAHIAELMQSNTRQGDLVCRLGGEEFVLICFDTSDAAILQLAERIRAAIEQSQVLPVGLVHPIRFTATIGVSKAFNALEGFDHTLQQADAALYYGKTSGRNRIELAGPHIPTQASVHAQKVPQPQETMMSTA